MRKANHDKLTPEKLKARADRSAAKGFRKQKWITFCETMLDAGFEVYLYEARRTVSKYITVKGHGKHYKVRFSNHAPILQREERGDCDFFVGRCNNITTTTPQAIAATLAYLNKEKGIKP